MTLYYNKKMYFAIAYASFYAVYAVIVPYLPILLREMAYGPSMVGILLGVFEAAGIAGPFIFGYWADKRGEYKTGLVFSHLLTFLPIIPLILVHNPFLTGIILIPMGIGFRSIVPLLDTVTTIGIGSDGNYGRVRLGGTIGFCCMLFVLQLTPWVKPTNQINIALWAGFITLLSAGSVIIIPQKYTNIGRQKHEKHQKKRSLSSVLVLGLIAMAFSRLGIVPVISFFSLFLTESLHWHAVGFMWALASITEIPAMLVSKRLINRIGSLPLLLVSSLSISIRLLICVLFPTRAGIIIAQLFHCISYGLFQPVAIAYITECVPPQQRAMGMSLYVSLGVGLPTLIGNILGGIIIEQMGYRALFGIFSVFPVLSLGLYFPLVLARKGRRNYDLP